MTAAAAAGSLACVMPWGECVNDALTSTFRRAQEVGASRVGGGEGQEGDAGDAADGSPLRFAADHVGVIPGRVQPGGLISAAPVVGPSPGQLVGDDRNEAD